MNDMRERLIELLTTYDRTYDCDLCPKDKHGKSCGNECLADYLLANGVTLQELDGCGFCQKFDFAGARAEVNKYGAHISLAICNTKFPDEERFKFCPMCGRRLPQPPKGE